MIGLGVQGQKSHPELINTWDTQQNALWNALSGQLNRGLTTEVNPYPGQMYAPQNQQETNYFNYINDNTAARQAAINRIGEVPYEINPEQTQELIDSRRRSAMHNWEQYTAPDIGEAFAGPGYWGTARANALTQGAMTRDVNLQQREEELRYGEILADRQSREAAAMREAQFGPNAAAQEANIMGTAGQYARGIENERIMADLQRWLGGETVNGESAQQYNPYMQLVFQALGLTPNALGQSSLAYGANMSVMGGGGGK